MKQFKLRDRDYEGSGVKTLRTVGSIFFWLGIIGAAGLILTSFILQNGYFFLASFAAILQGFAIRGFCNAIAKIAECQIYQRALLEYQMTPKKQEKKAEESGEEASPKTEEALA